MFLNFFKILIVIVLWNWVGFRDGKESIEGVEVWVDDFNNEEFFEMVFLSCLS